MSKLKPRSTITVTNFVFVTMLSGCAAAPTAEDVQDANSPNDGAVLDRQEVGLNDVNRADVQDGAVMVGMDGGEMDATIEDTGVVEDATEPQDSMEIIDGLDVPNRDVPNDRPTDIPNPRDVPSDVPTDVPSVRADVPSVDVIYLSPNGNDANTGFSMNAPVRTFARALSQAAIFLSEVRVANGTYSEVVTITRTLRISGGYDPMTWARTGMISSTVISAPGAGPALVFNGGGITPTVDRFTIRSTMPRMSDGTGVAVFVQNAARVSLLNTEIFAPNGAAGTAGAAGRDGVTVGCPNNGGAGGAPMCVVGAGEGSNGGDGAGGEAGGAGGMGGSSSCMMNACNTGNNAVTGGSPGGDGAPNASAPTAQAAAMRTAGSVNAMGVYVPERAPRGNSGRQGAGGGGGGAGGSKHVGCLGCNFDLAGGVGANGNPGGCGGEGGEGGLQGGGSYAVIAIAGQLDLGATTVRRGNGGAGGAGGASGAGQRSAGVNVVLNPGDDRFCGAVRFSAATGGIGGSGGSGSSGVGGSGGAGGPSVCVALVNGATVVAGGMPNCMGGAGGAGGAAGASTASPPPGPGPMPLMNNPPAAPAGPTGQVLGVQSYP